METWNFMNGTIHVWGNLFSTLNYIAIQIVFVYDTILFTESLVFCLKKYTDIAIIESDT